MGRAGLALINRRLSKPIRKQALFASIGAVLVVVAGTAWAGATVTSATAPDVATVTLSAAPLGVDVAQWDPLYSSQTTFNVVQPQLQAAGIDQLHYTGGVTADQYDWQTDTDITNCPDSDPSEFDAACAAIDPLDFATLSQHARALGAQTFATVNYGSGSPDLAAAWVTQAAGTTGQAVSDWEIGNESYGCWEVDDELTGPPADDTDYVPNETATCPMQYEGQDDGMATMAESYAENAADFMAAMKTADPNAQLGVPWAFDYTVGGAAVGDNSEWNDTILKDDGQYISFVEAHWYPYSFPGDVGVGGNPSAQAVIQSVEQIPSEFAKIQSTLNTYDAGAKVIIGETGVSYLATNVPCTPAGALFAAGDVLEWLASGAQSVDWWPMDTNANLGNTCAAPDEGMFTATGAPTTPYTGYLLASALAQPNARLASLSTSNGNVLAFESMLPSGQVAVALINTNTGSAEKVTVGSSLTGNLYSESYSAAGQNASNTKISDGTMTAAAVAAGVTLPAESILVLKTGAPVTTPVLGTAGITLGGSASFKAGTRVTLTGKLTIKGAAAPAGVPVKITRTMSGTTKNAATMVVRTVTGGGFTMADVPPAYGRYVYTASYTSHSYEPAAHAFAVKITEAKPTLKLAVSARAVKPGKKVTVTATLVAPHVNRTLVIYAQVKGGAKKVIKRATINAKGQLSVVFAVKANTTFIVAFSGDTWYSAATTGISVKT
jgi:hypothetical protein